MDWLSTLAFALGPAWISGINLYATVAVLGLAEHFGYAHLPGDLGVLGNWWIIGAAGFLYLIEFLADKIPVVDSVWDAVHTFIRIPAGALLAMSAFANFPAPVRIVALLLGGSMALASHGTKAAVRLAVNTSPEPVSNIVVSTLEDIFAFVATLVLVWKPVVILLAALLFACLAAWMAPKIVRGVRALFGKRKPPSSNRILTGDAL
jgi:hypothetical protein